MGIQLFQVPDNLTAEELMTLYVRHVVSVEGGNKTRAAKRLDIDRRTLYRHLEKKVG